jgi:hypothetical protein
MDLKEALFEKEKSIIISKKWGCDFNEDPLDVMSGIKKSDRISDKLNKLLIGVDISSFQRWRVEDSKGNFYYNTSGWNFVNLVQEQRKENPLLKEEKYLNRLKYGCGPYNIFIPEKICTIMEA